MYRYFLTDQLGTLGTEPLGASDFIITWAKEQEGSLREYVKAFDGNIVFTGEAFNRLLKLERSVYRCKIQYLSIEKKCQGEWQEIFNGGISLSSGEWNLDKCSVKLKFNEYKDSACLLENQNRDINILDIPNKYSINLKPVGITLEFVAYSEDIEQPNLPREPEPYWGGAGTPEAGNWNYYKHFERITYLFSPERILRSRVTNWLREVLEVPQGSAVEAGGGWSFIKTEGGKDFYSRFVSTYGCVDSYSYSGNTDTYEVECNYLGKDNANVVFKNAVKFKDAIQYLVNSICPGLDVVSDFFQINPENESLINYVTGVSTKVNNLFLLQASDVKRPNATGSATIAKINWDRLAEALKHLFNVEYKVIGNILRIEHVSFFTRSVGMDLTTEEYKKYLSGKNIYTYKNDDIPYKEVWNFPSPQSYGDFNGYPIIYDNGCVVNKKQEKSYNIDGFYTDIELALSNPGSDNQTVKDEAVFFVACGLSGLNYYILQEIGITSSTKVNNILSLAHLHRDYFKYERALPIGIMNGVLTEFNSIIPTKLGVKFSIPYCCPNNFSPDDLVLTPLGIGVVNSASFSFKNNTLELELLYDAFTDLEENTEPVARLDVVNTYDNSTILIDVLANDTYDVGDIIEIVQPPVLGSATVVGNKIQYSVNLGHGANTILAYRIKDVEWGIYSNIVAVTINIREANQPPIANPDSYSVIKDGILNIAAAQGVLANDTDDYGGLFITDYDTATTQGGSVNMSSNGSFIYNPPVGYSGLDSFNYTVEDSGGLKSIGSVSISVIMPAIPIAIQDNYIVTAGSTLVIDNSPGKPNLKANDYTPDSSPFSIQAQAVTSSRGVSVSILSNGNFTYTAPGTPGLDSFNYIAIGSDGTATGLAVVNVLPLIKIGLQITGTRHAENLVCSSSWIITDATVEHRGNVIAYFLDSSNNPIDLTGLGVYFDVQVTKEDYVNGNFTQTLTILASGSSVNIYTDFMIEEREERCAGEIRTDYKYSFGILPKPGYIVT